MNPGALGLATLGVAVAVIVLAIWVGRQPATADDKAAAKSVYAARRFYVIGLSAAIVVVLALTLSTNPYAAPSADVVVHVRSAMWSWQLEGAEQPLPVGKIIEFRVTSSDVNHGFGVYDPDGRLLTQVQAMPGYENRLSYEFERPGTYTIACMEFCGVAHQAMISQLEVK